MSLNKRTPCVGICSTTYGDLVCRGCKRFAHEIVQWNSYDKIQQEQIWQRLKRLRDEVVLHGVVVRDPVKFEAFRAQERFAALDGGELLYAVIRFLSTAGAALSEAGLAARVDGEHEALELLKSVDGEIYDRSKAHYERNFKVTA